MVAREIDGSKVILPIWHNISKEEVITYSPTLGDKVAISTANGIKNIVDSLIIKNNYFSPYKSTSNINSNKNIFKKNSLHGCFHKVWSVAATSKGIKNSQYKKEDWKRLEALLLSPYGCSIENNIKEIESLIKTLKEKENKLFSSKYENNWVDLDLAIKSLC